MSARKIKKRFCMRCLVICLLFLTVAALALQFSVTRFGQVALHNERAVELKLERGSGIKRLAHQLEREELISSALFFEVYARLFTDKVGIKAGEYLLEAGMTINQLLDELNKGHVKQYSFTLVEGWTLKQVLTALENTPKLLDKERLDEAGIATDLAIDESVEGWLFPDTYFYDADSSVISLLRRAHLRMRNVLEEQWAQREPGLPYKNAYEALIMASIVERETGAVAEREDIAGVFVRRLRKGMRLQTDPTVIYGMGDRYEGRIRYRHLREYTPYNTYRIPALPPTPIAMPGQEAIHAALHPRPGETLYFVARGDGSHQFSATLEAHNKAVKQYQLKRRDNYRSSPAPIETGEDKGSVGEVAND